MRFTAHVNKRMWLRQYGGGGCATYSFTCTYSYICATYSFTHADCNEFNTLQRVERWGAGVETRKNVRGEIGGWGRVPFNETYAPSLSTTTTGRRFHEIS